MKKFIFISAIAALTLAGCKIDESTTAKANHIYLSPTNIAALEVGSTQQISAVVTPASIESKHIVWVSDDTDIATVDALGLVKGIAPGQATIAAVSVDNEKILAECTVTVIKTIPITSGKIMPEAEHERTFWVGDIKEFRADLQLGPEAPTPTQSITWSTNSSKNLTLVPIVGQEGPESKPVYKVKVKALKEVADTEEVFLFISAGDRKLDSVRIYVYKHPVESVVIEGSDSLELMVDSTLQLSAVVTPDNATYPNISWKSGKETIATVDNTGLVKAIASGYAWIYAISDDDNTKKDSVFFTVPMPVLDD